MCWTNTIAIPIVLKKPLRVYKVGTSMISGNFRSLYHNFVYHRSKVMPTVKINPKFKRNSHFAIGLGERWKCDRFCINEGYHSYLTKGMAKSEMYYSNEIGIFEIPVGATVYIDYKCREVVSTDIKYLGLLKE